jgi:hypothetical protein
MTGITTDGRYAELMIAEARALALIRKNERSFQSLAATHATAGGINERFLKHMVEHGLLTRISEALDAFLHRIGVES